jgi:hypothetical protein
VNLPKSAEALAPPAPCSALIYGHAKMYHDAKKLPAWKATMVPASLLRAQRCGFGFDHARADIHAKLSLLFNPFPLPSRVRVATVP